MPPSRPFSGARAYQEFGRRGDHESRAPAKCAGLLRRLARKALLIAARPCRAILVERAQRAGRLLRRADRGAEIHQRLRAIPGARLRPSNVRPAAGSAAWPAATAPRPRTAATPRARYCRRPAWSDVEGDRRDRRRSIGPDPRQRAQAILGIRKDAAMIAQHRDRASVQVPRPRIIAEPGPHPQHLVERGAAERRDIGPARQEFLEIGPDGFDAGLLQHDLRQPHAVRIGPLARRRPPRQPAAMPVVPRQQQRGTIGGGTRRFSSFGLGGRGNS